MAVLPPATCKVAGLPKDMLRLAEIEDSPIADFFPIDFGLDLNGKRFTWQAVILLPFIDEPRLLRVLKPLIQHMTDKERERNDPHQNCLFAHVSDMGKKFPKNKTEKKMLRDQILDSWSADKKAAFQGPLFGFVEGRYGDGEDIESPIEGLPDVEETTCVQTFYTFPERVTHSVALMEGATFVQQVVDQSDLDDQSRMKGFAGLQARKIIMQALGELLVDQLFVIRPWRHVDIIIN